MFHICRIFAKEIVNQFTQCTVAVVLITPVDVNYVRAVSKWFICLANNSLYVICLFSVLQHIVFRYENDELVIYQNPLIKAFKIIIS